MREIGTDQLTIAVECAHAAPGEVLHVFDGRQWYFAIASHAAVHGSAVRAERAVLAPMPFTHYKRTCMCGDISCDSVVGDGRAPNRN